MAYKITIPIAHMLKQKLTTQALQVVRSLIFPNGFLAKHLWQVTFPQSEWLAMLPL